MINTTWTCCSCERQVEEQFMDTDERMCEDCMEEEDLDLPDRSLFIS
jgi:NMD protein affecting ribosome stability and mRNA decay